MCKLETTTALKFLSKHKFLLHSLMFKKYAWFRIHKRIYTSAKIKPLFSWAVLKISSKFVRSFIDRPRT